MLAIGNPLAYEHTVTVGVVSYIGRKLFDSALDRYIQTDAAINFGNSGGPLINSRGEVIGINAAISSRAANIGFAVPINQATAILPQLREHGQVSRGFIGVALKKVDPDLQRSLSLRTSAGALVQDVTEGTPGYRAGLKPYDVIVAVDGRQVTENDDLIQIIAGRKPGTVATLQIVRGGRTMNVPVKLAERPLRAENVVRPKSARHRGGASCPWAWRSAISTPMPRHLDLAPPAWHGVVVSPGRSRRRCVRGRHPARARPRNQPSAGALRRRFSASRRRRKSGDVLTLYIFNPGRDERSTPSRSIDREATHSGD